jgi:hypothetical protein
MAGKTTVRARFAGRAPAQRGKVPAGREGSTAVPVRRDVAAIQQALRVTLARRTGSGPRRQAAGPTEAPAHVRQPGRPKRRPKTSGSRPIDRGGQAPGGASATKPASAGARVP